MKIRPELSKVFIDFKTKHAKTVLLLKLYRVNTKTCLSELGYAEDNLCIRIITR